MNCPMVLLSRVAEKAWNAMAPLMLNFLGVVMHCVIILVCMVPILRMLPNEGSDESFNLATGLIVTWFCSNLSGSLFVVFIKKCKIRWYIINMTVLNIFLYSIFMFSYIAKRG